MTALALALVLCCAMVCGVFMFCVIRDERHQLRMKDRSDVGAIDRKVHLLDDAIGSHHKEIAALRSEVESLRAQVAVRSL